MLLRFVTPEFQIFLGAMLAPGIIPLMAYRNNALLRLWVAAILSIWVVSHGAVSVPTCIAESIPPQRARVEGQIIGIQSKGKVLLIAGEVDLQQAPALTCRTLLRVGESAVGRYRRGQSVVCYASLRIPRQALFEGDFSESDWASSCEAQFVGNVYRIAAVTLQPKSYGWIERLASACRDQLSRNVDSTVAHTLWALVLGDETGINSERREWYVLSGTAHILAVSGTHVALLVGIVLAFFGGHANRWWHIAIVGLVVGCFVIISGAQPPGIRAYLVSLLMLCGRLWQRNPDVLNVLGGVVLIQLLADPYSVRNAGFILSTTAMLGIVLILPRLHDRLLACVVLGGRGKKWLIGAVALNLSAGAAIGLPAALIFGAYAPWSVPVNLIVVPLLSLAMMCGFLQICLGWILPVLSVGIAFTAEVTIGAAEIAVQTAASHTPLFSPRNAILLSLTTLLWVLWLCTMSAYRQGLYRTVVIMLIYVGVGIHTPEPPNGVWMRAYGEQVELHAVLGNRHRRAILGMKNGIPFVRSLNERNTGKRGK